MDEKETDLNPFEDSFWLAGIIKREVSNLYDCSVGQEAWLAAQLRRFRRVWFERGRVQGLRDNHWVTAYSYRLKKIEMQRSRKRKPSYYVVHAEDIRLSKRMWDYLRLGRVVKQSRGCRE
jgi:hypothetical protein